MTLQED